MKSKINSNNQTKYFNSIFRPYFPDKNISSSLIRHIVISHFAEGEPTIEEEKAKEKEIEDKYMHSSAINKTYRKVDKEEKKEKKKDKKEDIPLEEVEIVVEEKPKKAPKKVKKVKKIKLVE